MARLDALNPETTTGQSKTLFDGINANLGMVPNMMRTMGNSPAVLEGYLNLSGTLSKGKLGAKLGELLALTVAQANGCEYCLSAHTYIGLNMVKIDAETIAAARQASNSDAKIQAALAFAHALVTKRGKVDDSDLEAVKTAGYDDGEIGEIVAHVALNTLTNYFNNTAQTTVDFPAVEVEV